MVKERSNLRVFFLPFMAHGHMIPAIDIAKLFASQGVESTIVTTPVNEALLSRSIARTNAKIHIQTIPFPAVEAGLPQGCENVDMITSFALVYNFLDCCQMLREPVEQLLKEELPDCLVADMFFPWATDLAGKFNIPRIVFHGTSAFSPCASEMVKLHEPHNYVSSDEETFLIPNLPDEIKLTRTQLPEFVRVDDDDNKFMRLLSEAKESELRSYGVIMNSFYELEPAYADFYRNVLKRRTWNIGPVSLCNRKNEDKISRGKQAAIDEQACLKWLDSKKANSVVYVCFGSTSRFPNHQLREIAMALEASGQQFIWVVKEGKDDETDEEYLPAGFSERIHDRGMIIRGWAPQVLILDHEAVGAFVTHCGWNSTLEGISAGVPMVTWPVFAEQFYNEKLMTEVLGIGVPVGAQRWAGIMEGDTIKKEAIEHAVRRVMVGEEAEDMRKRAIALEKMAKEAVEEGGSSCSDLKNLIQELKSR